MVGLAKMSTAASMLMQAGIHWRERRAVVARMRVRQDDGSKALLSLARLHVRRTRLTSRADGRWVLDMSYRGAGERLHYSQQGLRHLTDSIELSGDEAQRAAALLLPHINTVVGR